MTSTSSGSSFPATWAHCSSMGLWFSHVRRKFCVLCQAGDRWRSQRLCSLPWFTSPSSRGLCPPRSSEPCCTGAACCCLPSEPLVYTLHSLANATSSSLVFRTVRDCLPCVPHLGLKSIHLRPGHSPGKAARAHTVLACQRSQNLLLVLPPRPHFYFLFRFKTSWNLKIAPCKFREKPQNKKNDATTNQIRGKQKGKGGRACHKLYHCQHGNA